MAVEKRGGQAGLFESPSANDDLPPPLEAGSIWQVVSLLLSCFFTNLNFFEESFVLV